MRTVLCWTLLACLTLGCGQGTREIQSHGQPVSYWVELLKERDAGKRKQAVRALGHVGPADPAALPAVTGALKDPDARVRAEAALALLNVGLAAEAATADLEAAGNDKDPTVRTYARQALQRIQGK
jgi:HEAT repeat protein